MRFLTVVTLVALFVGSPSAAYAAIDCKKADAAMERLICSDSEVVSLDLQLNVVYDGVLNSAPASADALHVEQRRWLRDVRGRCTASDCLRDAYVERLRVLRGVLDRSLRAYPSGRVDDSPLTQNQAAKVCAAIVDRANQGRLEALAMSASDGNTSHRPKGRLSVSSREQERLQKERGLQMPSSLYGMRLRNGEPLVRFGEFSEGGTCGSYVVLNVDYLLTHEIGDGVADDGVQSFPDEPNDMYFGAREYPVFIDGRYYFVVAGFRDPDGVQLVSWVRPDGRVQPICMAEKSVDREVTTEASDPAVCRAVSRGAVQALDSPKDWETKHQDTQGRSADFRQSFILDLGGDGLPEHLDVYNWSSGGGCGAGGSWMEVQRDAAHPTPWVDALLKALPDGWVEPYQINGRAFLLAGSERDAHHEELLTIDAGAVKKVCGFRTQGTWRVTKMVLP